MRPIRAGQGLRHELFGFGTAIASTDDRTIVDFNDHGRKTFVTGLFDAELVADVPPKAKAPKEAKSPRPRSGKAAGKTR